MDRMETPLRSQDLSLFHELADRVNFSVEVATRFQGIDPSVLPPFLQFITDATSRLWGNWAVFNTVPKGDYIIDRTSGPTSNRKLPSGQSTGDVELLHPPSGKRSTVLVNLNSSNHEFFFLPDIYYPLTTIGGKGVGVGNFSQLPEALQYIPGDSSLYHLLLNNQAPAGLYGEKDARQDMKIAHDLIEVGARVMVPVAIIKPDRAQLREFIRSTNDPAILPMEKMLDIVEAEGDMAVIYIRAGGFPYRYEDVINLEDSNLTRETLFSMASMYLAEIGQHPDFAMHYGLESRFAKRLPRALGKLCQRLEKKTSMARIITSSEFGDLLELEAYMQGWNVGCFAAVSEKRYDSKLLLPLLAHYQDNIPGGIVADFEALLQTYDAKENGGSDGYHLPTEIGIEGEIKDSQRLFSRFISACAKSSLDGKANTSLLQRKTQHTLATRIESALRTGVSFAKTRALQTLTDHK